MRLLTREDMRRMRDARREKKNEAAGRCPHLFRTWNYQIDPDDASKPWRPKPWRTHWFPRDIRCTVREPHTVHQAPGHIWT